MKNMQTTPTADSAPTIPFSDLDHLHAALQNVLAALDACDNASHHLAMAGTGTHGLHKEFVALNHMENRCRQLYNRVARQAVRARSFARSAR